MTGRIRSKLTTLRKLSWAERALLVEAWLLMIGIRVNLKMFGLRRVQSSLERFVCGDALNTTRGNAPVSRALDVSRIVRIASRYAPIDNTCLDRSLALWWLLERRQIGCRLHYGVRKQADGAFDAHAWVECAGQVINDVQTVERDYAPLALTPSKHDA